MNSFFFHTQEIKHRCIYVCISLLTTFITCCIVIYPILFYMTKPLKVISKISLMVTDVLEFWVVAIHLSLFLCFFLSFPVFLYNVWAFFIPSIYPNENMKLNQLFLISFFLFVFGNIISFHHVLPLVISYCFQEEKIIGFLDLQYMPKLATYISFLSYYLLIFFCVFQSPVIFLGLIESRLLTYRKLSDYRKLIYMVFLLVIAFICPPDVLSQLFLTSISVILMEFLILYSCFFSKDQIEEKSKSPLSSKK